MTNTETRAFARGYFCAVAALLKHEGAGAAPKVRDLFRGGGDPSLADPDDQSAFIAAGLMPDPYAEDDFLIRSREARCTIHPDVRTADPRPR